MLDQPLTVGSLLLINGIVTAPIVVLLAKGVWYLSKMVHQHEQMWAWFNTTKERRAGRERRAVADSAD